MNDHAEQAKERVGRFQALEIAAATIEAMTETLSFETNSGGFTRGWESAIADVKELAAKAFEEI